MIVKSLTRKQSTFRQLLEYMMHDNDRLTKSGSFVLQHNIKGKTIDDWVRAFEQNEQDRIHRRSNNVKMYHEILSFSNKDIQKITTKTLKDIAKKYIQIRSEQALFIAIPHQDKEHLHIHFCMSGVEQYTGLSTRISREHFKEIKQEIQTYQIEHFPELSNSIVNHNKNSKDISDKEYQVKKRSGQTEKERIKQLLDTLYMQSNSQDDFYNRIHDNGLQVYERGGKNYGIVGDRKIRFVTLGFDEQKLELLNVRSEFELLRNEGKINREIKNR